MPYWFVLLSCCYHIKWFRHAFGFFLFKTVLITLEGVGRICRHLGEIYSHVYTFVCFCWYFQVECSRNGFSIMETSLVNVYLLMRFSGYDKLLALSSVPWCNNLHLLKMEICSIFCSIVSFFRNGPQCF